MILTVAALALQAAAPAAVTQPVRARANLSEYFSTDDYPLTALERRAQGTVGFRLQIGPDGAVTQCTVTHSAGDAALDAATCAIMLGRVRYSPARNAAGQPVPGKDEGRVTWRLPRQASAGMAFAPMRVVSKLRADGAGHLTCAVTINGVSHNSDYSPAFCGQLAGTGADRMLSQVPGATEVVMVSVTGPAAPGLDRRGDDETSYGALQFDLVVDLDIGRDGRPSRCSAVRHNVPQPEPLLSVPDLCMPAVAGAPPMFVPSDGPVRQASYRMAVYLSGWPIDHATPPAIAPRRP